MDDDEKKAKIYDEFPGLNDEIEQAKSGNVQVMISTSYGEDWGSKRMSNCYWTLSFRFSGEIMSSSGSSTAFIKKIQYDAPSDNWGSCVVHPIPEIDTWVKVEQSNPPWTRRLLTTSMSYRIHGHITDINDKVHPFSFKVEGDNSHIGNNADQYHYYHEGMINGHSLGRTQTYFITVDPPPIFQLNTRSCFHNENMKIMTKTGNPKEIIYLIKNGVKIQNPIIDEYEPGKFKLTEKVVVSDLKNIPRKNNSERNSFDEDRYLDIGVRKKDESLNCIWETDILFGGTVLVDILPEENHHLDYLKWLPPGKLGQIMSAITKDIFIETTRVCYSRVITYQDFKEPDLLLQEIGASELDRNTILTVLSAIITKHNSIADWKGRTMKKIDQKDHHKIQKRELDIRTTIKDKCLVPPYDINMGGNELTEQIITVLTEWERTSVQNYSRLLATEEHLKKEQYFYYNADRIIWLLIQKNHSLYSKLPIDVVRKIAFLLPSTLRGVLNFGYQYGVYYRCAGTDYYGGVVSIDPKKMMMTVWQRNNGTVTSTDHEFTLDRVTGDITSGYGKFSILPDVEYGGVYLNFGQNNTYHQLSTEDVATLQNNQDKTFRGGNRSKNQY